MPLTKAQRKYWAIKGKGLRCPECGDVVKERIDWDLDKVFYECLSGTCYWDRAMPLIGGE